MQRQHRIACRKFALARRWLTLLLMLSLPTAGAEVFLAPQTQAERLQVRTEQGDMLLDIAAPANMRWCVEWNHSVRKFTVQDCYQNVAGVMQLQRSHQPDFAAGLGHTLGRGEQVSDGAGGYWINAIDEAVPNNQYFLRVGAEAVNHRVVWPEEGLRKDVSLSAQAPGQRVTVQLVQSAPPYIN